MKRFIKHYLFWALIIALCSEVHFYPLNSFLRISLGVIILGTLILIRNDLNMTALTLLSGFVIFTERTLTSLIFSTSTSMEILTYAFPALVYYSMFSLLLAFADIHSHKDELFRTILVLAGIDIISNTIEAAIRGGFTSRTLSVIILVGLIRGAAAYSIFFAWRKKELFIIQQEHQKRYSQLNMLVANVESELFYLKKSAGDIESVMGKCYSLYETADITSENKTELLDISKDIHEIKKDYLRVLNGFSDFVEKIQDLNHLQVSDIFDIIKTNYKKVLKSHNYKIDLIFEQNTNPEIEQYLSIFTILNNLIDNSLDAFKKDGTLRIIYKETGDSHQLIVMDNARGMNNETMRLIFNPGFTTKYDENGKASTGIGLPHVKNTVDLLHGTINMDSIEGSGTKFIIKFPKVIGANDE